VIAWSLLALSLTKILSNREREVRVYIFRSVHSGFDSIRIAPLSGCVASLLLAPPGIRTPQRLVIDAAEVVAASDPEERR
jgi:hypothetical protein